MTEVFPVDYVEAMRANCAVEVSGPQCTGKYYINILISAFGCLKYSRRQQMLLLCLLSLKHLLRALCVKRKLITKLFPALCFAYCKRLQWIRVLIKQFMLWNILHGVGVNENNSGDGVDTENHSYFLYFVFGVNLTILKISLAQTLPRSSSFCFAWHNVF